MDKPYYEFLQRFKTEIGPISHINRPENTKAVVMIEGGCNWELPIVMRNFRHFLGPDWNFKFFGTAPSIDYLLKELDNWVFGDDEEYRNVYQLDASIITPTTASDLVSQSTFWESFTEETILSISCDSICCQPLDEKYLAYDMIGAPCGEGGMTFNDGLALRKKSTMLKALKIFGGFRNGELCDVFLTRCMRKLGKHIPDQYTAAQFSVESFYYGLPFGVHGTNKGYHSLGVANQIVEQIKF